MEKKHDDWFVVSKIKQLIAESANGSVDSGKKSVGSVERVIATDKGILSTKDSDDVSSSSQTPPTPLSPYLPPIPGKPNPLLFGATGEQSFILRQRLIDSLEGTTHSRSLDRKHYFRVLNANLSVSGGVDAINPLLGMVTGDGYNNVSGSSIKIKRLSFHLYFFIDPVNTVPVSLPEDLNMRYFMIIDKIPTTPATGPTLISIDQNPPNNDNILSGLGNAAMPFGGLTVAPRNPKTMGLYDVLIDERLHCVPRNSMVYQQAAAAQSTFGQWGWHVTMDRHMDMNVDFDDTAGTLSPICNSPWFYTKIDNTVALNSMNNVYGSFMVSHVEFCDNIKC